jgi:hypothetical protein
MVNACLETKSNLDFFNGVDFLVHVPYKHLVDSIILTSNNEYTLTEHLINKSKIAILLLNFRVRKGCSIILYVSQASTIEVITAIKRVFILSSLPSIFLVKNKIGQCQRYSG